MNALSLYVTTCRMIFQAEQDSAAGQGAWSDINRLILYLRQALTCCVCGKLLTVPMSSTGKFSEPSAPSIRTLFGGLSKKEVIIVTMTLILHIFSFFLSTSRMQGLCWRQNAFKTIM